VKPGCMAVSEAAWVRCIPLAPIYREKNAVNVPTNTYESGKKMADPMMITPHWTESVTTTALKSPRMV
jgi:hypothetical protein